MARKLSALEQQQLNLKIVFLIQERGLGYSARHTLPTHKILSLYTKENDTKQVTYKIPYGENNEEFLAHLTREIDMSIMLGEL